MARILDTTEPGFEARFAALQGERGMARDVEAAVDVILADVRARGDAALVELTHRFDDVELTPGTIALSEDEIDALCARVPAAERAALERAAQRIRAFHERQVPSPARWTDEAGATLGWRWTPVEAAGLYAPGGTASYPSSVLMNAIPARVAGVRRLVMCTPTPQGAMNPLVALAARLAEVDEVLRLGGAQAIGALAYGTETVAPVDVVVGPGNAYVAAAKRRVFGRVGIDTVAGPSEVLVIADAAQDPDWIAADLLSQAEHDALAQAVLIATDEALARAVAEAVERRLAALDRGAIAGAAWRDHGAVIVARDLEEAAALADRIAPEHLELCVADPDALAARIRHAGAIFLGPWTPEAVGDYAGGPNHVLPTAGAARFASGLSVMDFLKRTTLLGLTPEALGDIGPVAETLGALGGARGARALGAAEARPAEPGGGVTRLASVAIDDAALPPPTPEIEQERRVAIFDLLEDNAFALPDGRASGPYDLLLAIREGRLVFDLAVADGPETGRQGRGEGTRGAKAAEFHLSLGPFRQVVKDYFQICEAYFSAVKTMPPSQIEAIDMARRGIHDEGARVLIERLEGKAEVDRDTARRLFTLICVLHFGG